MHKRTQAGMIVAALLLSLGAAGCADKDEGPRFNAAAPAAAEADNRGKGTELPAGAVDASKAGAKSPDGDSAALGRKLIQTGELRLNVDAYLDARSAIEAELKRVGGYISDARIEHRDDQVSNAVLTLRIPNAAFHGFLRSAAGQGSVEHEQLKSQDVTDAYVDTAARLKNAKRLETRLLQLLAEKTDGVKDLLEVERELARVREGIERHEGQLQAYDKQVAFSTLTLELRTRQVFRAGPSASLSERLSHTFSRSAGSMVTVGRGLLLVLVALIPWLLPLGLLAAVALWLFRRYVAKPRQIRRANAVAGSGG